jgi:glucosamine--fructose-6-phosphate aminotransferase (isomerizing)
MAASFMEAEIRSQPALLARLAEEAAPLVADLGRVIARRRPRFAILAARGTSDHAAIYGKYLLETEGGLVASLAAPSVYSVYGRSPDVRDALAIGISQSGQSPDIVAAIDGARRGGALALAVTNDETSPLARVADLVLPLRVGSERSIAATKTFTAELLALWLLVGAVAGAGPGAARGLGQQTGESLAAAERALAGFSLGDGASPIVVVGRGYSFPIALEVALKLREGGLRNAQGYSAADLLHGSIAAVHADTAAILVGAAGPTVPSLLDCATALRERGARTIVISDVPELREGADVAIPVQAGCESLAVIPIAVAGQWLALQDAVRRGLDPDRPPGLVKVIRTV